MNAESEKTHVVLAKSIGGNLNAQEKKTKTQTLTKLHIFNSTYFYAACDVICVAAIKSSIVHYSYIIYSLSK